jgi:hypothetical protein
VDTIAEYNLKKYIFIVIYDEMPDWKVWKLRGKDFKNLIVNVYKYRKHQNCAEKNFPAHSKDSSLDEMESNLAQINVIR